MVATVPTTLTVVLTLTKMMITTAMALAMLNLDHEARCSQHMQTYDARSSNVE